MCRSLLILLSLAVCATAKNPANPAIKAILTNKGLSYGKMVGTEWLQAEILQAQIPDMSGDISLSLLGTVHYTLSRMGVARLNMPLPSVTFTEGTGLQVNFSGLNIAVKGKWDAHYLLLRDGGTFRVGLFNVGLSVLLQLGRDKQGHLSLATVNCESSIGGMDILFHGRYSWIIQKFVQKFKGQLQARIQQEICPTVQQSIERMENHLAAMNVSFQMDPVLLLDMPLTSTPAIRASDISLDFKGQFYNARSPKEPPFVSQPFQLLPQQRYMLSLGISEFTFNTAAFVYHTAGFNQWNITDKMIPPGIPFRLNTTSFGVFVPQLPQMFPNMLMLFHVYTTSTPMFSFLPDNVTAQVSLSGQAYAIKPAAYLIPLFRLDLCVNFNGTFFVEDEKLKGSVMLSNFTLTLGSTEVGPFNTANLQKALQIVILHFMLPKLNANLKAGIPLPGPLLWTNTVLKVDKGFAAFATDIKPLKKLQEEPASRKFQWRTKI